MAWEFSQKTLNRGTMLGKNCERLTNTSRNKNETHYIRIDYLNDCSNRQIPLQVTLLPKYTNKTILIRFSAQFLHRLNLCLVDSRTGYLRRLSSPVWTRKTCHSLDGNGPETETSKCYPIFLFFQSKLSNRRGTPMDPAHGCFPP